MLCTFYGSKRSVKHSLLALAAGLRLSTFYSSAYLHVCASASVAYDHYFTFGQDGEPQATAKWTSDLAFGAMDQHVEGECRFAQIY